MYSDEPKSIQPIKTLFIVGPTGVGKTEVAVEVASRLHTDIISADSMQVYKGLDIGSAKPSIEELRKAPHHLIDIVDPKVAFNVSKYAPLAREFIQKMVKNGKFPIVCGGTGLYISAIIYDMDFSMTTIDSPLRKLLEEEAERYGNTYIHDKLRAINPEIAENIHPNRRKRVIRALEVMQQNPEGLREFSEAKVLNEDLIPVVILLTRDRPELYARINSRVDELIKKGLVDEVRGLLDAGLSESDISYKGIGYKEVAEFLAGRTSLSEAVDLVKQSSRRYAKRQLTWFRGYGELIWEINLSETSLDEAVLQILARIV